MKVFLLVLLAFGACFARIVRRTFSCGSQEYLTTDNGVIDSHGGHAAGLHYGKSMDCSWTIEAPAGKYVEVWAQSFDTEDDTACSYDYLELLDGSSLNSKSMGKFCGSSFDPISSTQHFLTLHFVTDESSQLMGFSMHYNFTDVIVHTCHASQFHCNNSKCVSASFRCDSDDDCGDASDEQGCSGFIPGVNVTATPCDADEFQCRDKSACVPRGWTCDGDDDCVDSSDELPSTCLTPAIRPTIHAPVNSGCGQTNYTGRSGTITSPHYHSGNYINNAMCVWTIRAPPGTQTLAFKFDPVFNIEDDTACSYDFVDVYSDGHSFNHGPFCGQTSPGQFTMPGDHAYVEFSSDNSDGYPGFRLDWKALYHSNYARWVPIHVRDLVEFLFCEASSALCGHKYEHKFSRMAKDQSHQQMNKPNFSKVMADLYDNTYTITVYMLAGPDCVRMIEERFDRSSRIGTAFIKGMQYFTNVVTTNQNAKSVASHRSSASRS